MRVEGCVSRPLFSIGFVHVYAYCTSADLCISPGSVKVYACFYRLMSSCPVGRRPT